MFPFKVFGFLSHKLRVDSLLSIKLEQCHSHLIIHRGFITVVCYPRCGYRRQNWLRTSRLSQFGCSATEILLYC